MISPTLPPLPGLADDTVAAITGRSLWADARRRFLRNRAALVSLAVLSVIVVLCLAGPALSPPNSVAVPPQSFPRMKRGWCSFTLTKVGTCWLRSR